MWEDHYFCDKYLIFSEIAIPDSPIGLVIHVNLLQRGEKVFSQFMHLTDALGLLEYSNIKLFHNSILNVLKVILEGGTVLVPHLFSTQTKTPF